MASDSPPAPRSRRSSGAVTLRDVAKLAGVAPITVSRAVNTPNQVSEEVLARVRDAVARTGYVPNLLAGGLASRRSRVVAAVVPTIAGQVFAKTIEALTDTLAEHGYQLMLGQSGYAENREDALLDAIIGRRPDGIVLTGIMHSPEGRRRLLASGIPVVETWDLTPTPIDMLVGFSQEAVGRQVVDYLHAKGRRRLAVIVGRDERARRRLTAFVSRARELGLDDVKVAEVPPPTTIRSGRAALAGWLDGKVEIDGLFCSSDMLALGVLAEAQARNVAIPEQLAIVGFGDLEFAADVHPALTSVHVNGAAIGREAARLIIDRAEGRPVDERIIDVPISIVERDSG